MRAIDQEEARLFKEWYEEQTRLQREAEEARRKQEEEDVLVGPEPSAGEKRAGISDYGGALRPGKCCIEILLLKTEVEYPSECNTMCAENNST